MKQLRPGRKLSLRDVLYRKEDGLVVVTINRPEVHNAFRTQTLQELTTALHAAAWDDSVFAIVMTGAGTRAFCAGADLGEYTRIYIRKPREYWKYMALMRGALESILHAGKPVIARLNGFAVGGGNEFQLACDLTIMAAHGFLGQVGTSVGSVACAGATQWLPLLVGDKRAREMLFLNPRIQAQKALEWGIVNQVVPSVKRGKSFLSDPEPEEIDLAQKGADGYSIDLARLDDAVRSCAKQLGQKFPECMRYTKTQVNALKEFVWHMTIPHAQDWLSMHFLGIEPHLGMRAFLEKKPADTARARRSEFLWGAPEKSCRCGASGLPGDFAYCGRCGKRL